eukprot:2020808-Rhodomonas_salina.1
MPRCGEINDFITYKHTTHEFTAAVLLFMLTMRLPGLKKPLFKPTVLNILARVLNIFGGRLAAEQQRSEPGRTTGYERGEDQGGG